MQSLRELLRHHRLHGLALGAILLAGCGSAGSPPSGSAPVSGATPNVAPAGTSTAPTASSPASAATSGPDGAISEDLTFTGALAGHLTTGHRGDTYVCTGGNFVNNPNTKGQLVVGPIVGDLGGKQVRMSITKIDYHGPGSYDAGGVSFDVGSDHYYPASAPSGTLTVSPTGRDGTITMDLAVNSAKATTVGHVQGNWQCPPDPY